MYVQTHCANIVTIWKKTNKQQNLQVHIMVQYKENKENLNIVSCSRWREESLFPHSNISLLNQCVCVYANGLANVELWKMVHEIK